MQNTKLYVLFIILVMLTGSFFPVTALLSNNVTIRNSGTVLPILPLHVEGRYIKNSLGQIVYLRGINKHGFEGSPYGDWQTPSGSIVWSTFDPTIVAANLDAMKSWGMNTVRCYSCAEFWINNTGGHREVVKQLAVLLAERGMYLIYTFWRADYGAPQQNLPYPTTAIPNATAFVNLWSNIANELKGYPNIIFSLWNEPEPPNETVRAEWFTTVQSCINAIRETGATNLIIVQSDGILYNMDYGQAPTNSPSPYGDTLWWIEAYPLNDSLGNLVYEFHNYRGGLHKFVNGTRVDVWEYDDLKEGFQYALVEYVLFNLNKPLIVGEIGPNMWSTGEELQHELQFYQNALQLFKDWEMNFIGFWWWPAGTYAHLTGNPNYEPNQAGQILKSALSR